MKARPAVLSRLTPQYGVVGPSFSAVLAGVGVYTVLWLAAAALWSSYDAVPASLPWLLLLLVAVGTFAGRWASAPLVVATCLGAALLVAALGLLGGSAWMPVEPVTLAVGLIVASPLLYAACRLGSWRPGRAATLT